MIERSEQFRSPADQISDRRPFVGLGTFYPLLGLVFIGSAVLRLWRIDAMFHFMGDEGTQTLAEWKLIHGTLPELGPSLSIGTMHLGPLFYYLAAGPLAVAGGSPVGPTVMVALFGIAAVVLLYAYLRPAVGAAPALGASAAMGASFLMVEYSRRPWNPTLTPFFALVFLWGLVAWKRRGPAWIVLVSAALACLLQLQPVNLFFVPLLIAYVIAARPPLPSRLAVGGAIAVFLLISSPLIIYDLTHHFANTHAWLDALVRGKSTAAPRHASSARLLFNLFHRAYGLPIVAISIALAGVTVLSLIVSAFSSRSADGDVNWEIILPLLLLAIVAVGFQLYHKQVFEQYMVCLFVVPFIAVGALLNLLWRWRAGRYAGIGLVLVLVSLGVRDDWRYSFDTPKVTVADAAVTHDDMQPDDTYQHVQAVDRTIVRWAHSRPFDLTMASYLNTDAAYRYVLMRDGHAPTRTSLTYILIEPASWPQSKWPSSVRSMVALASRSTRIGLVRLYEVP